jgi:hypothetical protein
MSQQGQWNVVNLFANKAEVPMTSPEERNPTKDEDKESQVSRDDDKEAQVSKDKDEESQESPEQGGGREEGPEVSQSPGGQDASAPWSEPACEQSQEPKQQQEPVPPNEARPSEEPEVSQTRETEQGPEVVADRVFNTNYEVLESDVDQMHAEVLKVSEGSTGLSGPTLLRGDLTADLTWLLVGASPRKMKWEDKQIFQIDFPARALAARTFNVKKNTWLTPVYL